MQLLNQKSFGATRLAGGLAVCSIALFSVSAVLAGPKGAVGDLYVASAGGNAIVQVDSITGAVVGDFATDGVNNPFDARFGPNGNLFVVNLGGNNVTEYDGNTGTLVGTFASDGMSIPSGLRFEANGNLLVYNAGLGSITEYDSTGALLGTFASGLGGDDAPLDFGPGGDLYVSNFGGFVQRFGADGTDKGVFASGGSLSGAESHVFGPNGNLFVSSFIGNTVVEFDGTTGALVGDFINTNLNQPTGIAFGPDGNVWIANWGGGSGIDINEFDATGFWIKQVTGFSGALSITVKPDTGPNDCITLTVSTLTGGQNGQWDVSGATAGSLVAVVYGLQAGSTIVNGQLGFCATFGISGVTQSKLVGTAVADGSGNASIVKTVPGGAVGLTVLTQAAEKGTCPNECVSNLDTQVVQ